MSVIDILYSIGYTNISQMGDFLRMKPIYRSVNSSAPLSVNRKTGFFTDFGTSTTGNINQLVMLSLGCSAEEAKKITQSEYIIEAPKESRMLDVPLTLNKDEIKLLLPSYHYFNKRGISTDTLKHYEAGLATQGKMSDRFTFPILNKKSQLVGLAGRDVTNYKSAKWKILGRKATFDYPYFFNKKELSSASNVILVEGISDLLSLHEAGLQNALVLFGLTLGKELVSTLLMLNKPIWICTNNDAVKEDGSTPGQTAALKLKSELSKWFSEENIFIKLPPKPDFGEMTTQEIEDWYNEQYNTRRNQ